MKTQIRTTPNGRTVYLYRVDHKRGALTGVSTRDGGAPLLVIGTNHRVHREHTGYSHCVTAWHDGDTALGGFRAGPKGEDHFGRRSAILSALEYIDQMDLPETPCMFHPSQPAASSEGQPARCTSCLESARATAARLAAETA